MSADLVASYAQRLHDTLLEMARSYRTQLRAALLVEGHPPGTVRLSPPEEYARLQALFAEQDPTVLQDPAAVARLLELEKQYGPKPGQVKILGG